MPTLKLVIFINRSSRSMMNSKTFDISETAKMCRWCLHKVSMRELQAKRETTRFAFFSVMSASNSLDFINGGRDDRHSSEGNKAESGPNTNICKKSDFRISCLQVLLVLIKALPRQWVPCALRPRAYKLRNRSAYSINVSFNIKSGSTFAVDGINIIRNKVFHSTTNRTRYARRTACQIVL